MSEGDYFLIYNTGMDDPVPLIGPFPTYHAALKEYRERLVSSGADLDEEETAEDLYFTDDTVVIGRVESGGKPELFV